MGRRLSGAVSRDVDVEGERVTGCTIGSKRRVKARWYIDATGTARLLARKMRIPWTEYGRKKVCLWTYFDTPPLADGTTFFLDNVDAYLSWIWDIPISPQRTSVGFVLPVETVQARRRGGRHEQGDPAERAGSLLALRESSRGAAAISTCNACRFDRT